MKFKKRKPDGVFRLHPPVDANGDVPNARRLRLVLDWFDPLHRIRRGFLVQLDEFGATWAVKKRWLRTGDSGTFPIYLKTKQEKT